VLLILEIFTVPDSIFVTSERIELKGYLYQANYSSNGSRITPLAPVDSASVNLTIRSSSNASSITNYTITTDANGTFYTKSNFYSSAVEINASATAGSYILRAEYKDPINTTWFSEFEITVINTSLDVIRVSSDKARYYPSERINIEVEALKEIGDNILHIVNISVNGTLRNSAKTIISSFNCTTGDNGKCSVNLTAPTTYGNYTSGNFNASAVNLTFCPDNNAWGSGSWGGYHYLTVVIKDNTDNSTQTGWLNFRSVPFSISWGSMVGGTSKATLAKAVIPVNITRSSTGAATSGNLSSIYQWRYDDAYNGKQTYIFSVGSCYSNVSGQCTVNGSQNITVYPPSGGWKIGYNYLNTEWNSVTSASAKVEDWSGIYIDGRQSYNGYFLNSDATINYKYDFNETENITIKLVIQNISYNNIGANLTNVWYAFSSGGCWDEACRSYTSATIQLVGGGVAITPNGSIISISAPSGGWNKGSYYIKAAVSGSAGTGTITGGMVNIKDLAAPNISVWSPLINQTITTSNFTINFTTDEVASCSITLDSYTSFHGYRCGNWNVSNGTGIVDSAWVDSCNTTKYNFTGSTYYNEYISKDYHSSYNYSHYWYKSGTTGLTTDSTSHFYVFNITNKISNTNLTAQDYGITMICFDSDWNMGSGFTAIKIT